MILSAVNSPHDISATLRNSRIVIAVVGPTASGKTAVGIQLALKLNAEIISADSRQIYCHLDIGTAKPSKELRSLVPHHFVDELPPDTDFSSGEFGIRGREVIADIFRRCRVPLVVGGSGLYVKSLLEGFFEGPGSDPETRAGLERRLASDGIMPLLNQLKAVDPGFAATADPSKPRRILRALEVYLVSGIPLSKHQSERPPRIEFSHISYGLLWERSALYRRIDERCDEMIRMGLLDEVERLAQRGYAQQLNALNTVGYAEVFAHRRGEIGFDEMIRRIKRNSRNYAKRQMTWFRKDRRIRWIDAAVSTDAIVDRIVSDLTGTLP